MPCQAQEKQIAWTGMTFSAMTESRTAALLCGIIITSNSLLCGCWKGDIFPLRIVLISSGNKRLTELRQYQLQGLFSAE